MRRLLATAVILVAAACAQTASPASSPEQPSTAGEIALPDISASDLAGQAEPFGELELEVVSPDGEQRVPFSVYDAATFPTRARGFMEVREIPDGVGMIFRFGRPQEGGFWMKNVVVPLSIAFADADGVIVDMFDMEPCLQDPCTIYRPDAMYAYALEVRQGVFAEHGITEGWVLDVPEGLPAAD